MKHIKSKSVALLALAGGYILGSRAGSAPYQRMKSTMFKVRQDPRVQKMAHDVEDTARVTAQAAGENLRQAAQSTAENVSNKVADVKEAVENRK